jgi:tRNA threonylcarbamoyladenosine biosynthesis protein TsaE
MPEIKYIERMVLSSPQETIDLATKIAARLQPGDIAYLYGELGSGKTVFAKGLCIGLGIKEEVTSSSFVIVTEYAGRIPVVHIDLYRLDKAALDILPIDEYIIGHGITIIEWADRLNTKAGPGLHVKIMINKQNKREVSIEDRRR